MMKTTLATLLLATAVTAARGNDVLLTADFNKGIPTEFELINNDNLTVNQADFKKLLPKNTWFAGEVYGADGTAAISVSRRTPANGATENWLILPQLHIPEGGMWMQWSARSMHYELRDGYTVMVSAGDYTQFKPLLTVEAENYDWTKRVVSLADYAGKDVYLAILHNATNKFALAVDDVFVGVPAGYAVNAENRSAHFVSGTDRAALEFAVFNAGKTIEPQALVLEVEGGETLRSDYTQTLATGEEATLTFDLPVETGKAYKYTAKLETADGTAIDLLTDLVTCSAYPRTLLLEKFTGVWCNNCTSAIPFVNRVKDRLKDEVAVVEVHGYTKDVDPMSCDKYGISIGVMNYPTVLFNREGTHSQTGGWNQDDHLEAVMRMSAEAGVEAEAEWMEDGRIRIDATARFANDLDNSLARYRIGVLLRENGLDNTVLDYYQQNNCTNLSDQEFAYMPGTLTGNLIAFHQVARGGDTDESVKQMGLVNGLKGSLPEQLQAGVDYHTSLEIDLPETVIDPRNLMAVVVLFNNMSVMNADVVEKIGSSAGIGAGRSEKQGLQLLAGDNGGVEVRLPAAGPYRIEVYRMDGQCIGTCSGEGTACTLPMDYGQLPGCYLVRAVQDGAAACAKLLVK